MGCKSSTERPKTRSFTLRRRPTNGHQSFLMDGPPTASAGGDGGMPFDGSASQRPLHHRYIIDGANSTYGGHNPAAAAPLSSRGSYLFSSDDASERDYYQQPHEYDHSRDIEEEGEVGYHHPNHYDGIPTEESIFTDPLPDEVAQRSSARRVGGGGSRREGVDMDDDDEGWTFTDDVHTMGATHEVTDEEEDTERVMMDLDGEDDHDTASDDGSDLIITMENPFHPDFDRDAELPVPFCLLPTHCSRFKVDSNRVEKLLAYRQSCRIIPVPQPTCCRRCPLCATCTLHVSICQVDGGPHGGSTRTDDLPDQTDCTMEFGLGAFERHFVRLSAEHPTCLESQSTISLQTLHANLARLGLGISETLALFIIRRLFFAYQFINWSGIDLNINRLSAANVLISVPNCPKLAGTVQVRIVALAPPPRYQGYAASASGVAHLRDTTGMLIDGTAHDLPEGISGYPYQHHHQSAADPQGYTPDTPVVGFPLHGVFPSLESLLTGPGPQCPLSQCFLFQPEFWRETAHVRGIQSLSEVETEDTISSLVRAVARLHTPIRCIGGSDGHTGTPYC